MSAARPITSLAVLASLSLAMTACSASAPETTATTSAATTVTVEDNNGTETVQLPPHSVVALDNRTFETLADWGVKLSAAAVTLMPATVSYKSDASIVDIGLHTEPNLEALVAVEPDLIINGQRFSQHQQAITELVPDATVLDLEPREGEPFDEELKRQVTTLGEVLGKQDEAKELVDELDEAIERARAAYDDADTVMAVSTSGGEIGYLAPSVGRTLGPAYDILGLTPALEVADASDNHRGDDISVEAIAAANPDWLLVMDRDAAIAADDPDYAPASDILENSEALTGVTAIQEDRLVYMPADTYSNEGIQTYIEFFNDFADALEGAA